MLANILDPSHPFQNKPKWYMYILWAVIGALAATVLTYVFNITGLVADRSYQEAADGLFNASPYIPVLVIMYCVISPTVEETLFRFLLFGFINKKTGKAPVAILVSSVVFGIYHLNPVQMLYGFLMGLIIAASYHRNRNLLIPIITHAAANAMALVITFLL